MVRINNGYSLLRLLWDLLDVCPYLRLFSNTWGKFSTPKRFEFVHLHGSWVSLPKPYLPLTFHACSIGIHVRWSSWPVNVVIPTSNRYLFTNRNVSPRFIVFENSVFVYKWNKRDSKISVMYSYTVRNPPPAIRSSLRALYAICYLIP